MIGRLRLSKYLPLALLIALCSIGCSARSSFRQTPAVYTQPYECDYCNSQARPPKNVLVISGGGLYGAYLAGFLNGWSNTGTRPEFDVVTGISTGSLIGLCAFLGPEYDQLVKTTYTMAEPSEIYTVRSWYTLPFAPSVASNAPFRERIEKAITPELIAKMAQAHQAGRRFYVGTTNLETKRLVVWDMGAMACRGTQESQTLFKSVLLASCAIPGVFPPSQITINENGTTRNEWHIDGGASAPLFIPDGVLTPANAQTGMTVHGFISGKYFSDTAEVTRPRVLNVLKATVPAVTHAHARSELASISHQAKLVGAGFVCTALPHDFSISGSLINISTQDLNRLFLEGYRYGSSGPIWDANPPTKSAVTDPPRQ
jgi:predicted patatin/cPLA2 family phospholipase